MRWRTPCSRRNGSAGGPEPQTAGDLQLFRRQGLPDGLKEAASQFRAAAHVLLVGPFPPAGSEADGDVLVDGADRLHHLLFGTRGLF